MKVNAKSLFNKTKNKAFNWSKWIYLKKEIEENLVFDWIDLEEWLSTNFEAKNRSVDERAYLIFIFLMFFISNSFFLLFYLLRQEFILNLYFYLVHKILNAFAKVLKTEVLKCSMQCWSFLSILFLIVRN